MSSGNGLATGAGIANGVSAFTQAFLQARQQKNMMEISKNDRLANLLLDQIKDENTSHYKRSALIDEYQKLYDPKAKQPLSQILGLHKINDEDYVVEEGSKGTPAKPASTFVDKNAEQSGYPGMLSSVNLKGTEATQDVPTLTKKYGETTPNEIKLKLQRDLEDVRSKREVEQAKQLYKAQQEILNADGFNIKVAEGYDAQGNYQVVFKNKPGEIQKINLGNFRPDVLTKAGITAAGGSSGKPSVFVRDQAGYWQTQINPQTGQKYTQQEAFELAFKDADERFGSQQNLRGVQTDALGQSLTGTKPITPAQNADDEFRNQQLQLGLQTSLDNFTSQSVAAEADMEAKEAEANNHWNNTVQPIKDRMATMEVGTQEYEQQQSRYNAATRDNQHLKNLYNIAKKTNTKLKEQAKAAEKRLKDFSPIKSSTKSTKSLSGKISAVDQKALNVIKNNPKNASIIAGKSDQEILDYLRSKGIIK